jgi:hypothetical protein
MKKVRVTIPNKRKARVSIPKAQVGLPSWGMIDRALESIQKTQEPVDLSPTNTSPGAPAFGDPYETEDQKSEPVKEGQNYGVNMDDFPVIAPEGTDYNVGRGLSDFIKGDPLEKIETPKTPLLKTPDPEPTVKEPYLDPAVEKKLNKEAVKSKALNALDKGTRPLANAVMYASMLDNVLDRKRFKQKRNKMMAWQQPDTYYDDDQGRVDVNTGLEGDVIAGVNLPSGYDAYRQGFSSQMNLSKQGGELDVDSKTIAKLIAAGANIEIL